MEWDLIWICVLLQFQTISGGSSNLWSTSAPIDKHAKRDDGSASQSRRDSTHAGVVAFPLCLPRCAVHLIPDSFILKCNVFRGARITWIRCRYQVKIPKLPLAFSQTMSCNAHPSFRGTRCSAGVKFNMTPKTKADSTKRWFRMSRW